MENTPTAGIIASQIIRQGYQNAYPETPERMVYQYNPPEAEEAFLALARQMEPNFTITERNAPIYRRLVQYAFADKACGLNVDKSIGLMGNTGSGKTLAISVLGELIRAYDVRYRRGERIVPFAFRLFSARRIVSEFAASGYDGIFPYLHYNNICIDDLGSEPQEVVHYGNKLNVIEHIIEERYLARKVTHFTTNLHIGQIEQLYGQRVRSRIVHTTNLVELVHDDWRERI